MLAVGFNLFEDTVAPAVGTAVEAVAEIVLGELVLNAVNRHTALGYTVGIAAYRSAEVVVIVLGEVLLDSVETENYVSKVSVPVGDHDGNDAGAEVGDADFHTLSIRESEEFSLRAFVFRLEILGIKPRFCNLGGASDGKKDRQ